MSALPGYAPRSTDLDAFNRLVAEHQTLLYTVAYRLLGEAGAADTVTQAAVRQAYERPCPTDFSPRAWLLRCLLALCPSEGGGTGPGSARGLLALPTGQRQVLALVDLAGLDYVQAAVVLDLTTAQVSAQLAAARRALMLHLNSGGSLTQS